jgi:prolyl 4-hydroxylase
VASAPQQAQSLVAQGRVDQAAEILIRAAEGGDADALFTLATWRIQGNLVARDLTAARDLMGRAAEQGRPDAGLLHAYFLANGTGGDSQWGRARDLLAGIADRDPAVREQLDLIAESPVDSDGNPTDIPEPNRISETPWVVSAKQLIGENERAYLVKKAEPYLRRSVVVDRATGRTLAHPDRKSDNMLFGVGNEDLVISALRRRVAAFCGVDVVQTEPLQIIRYGVGDEFRPHLDAVPAGEKQRIMTALVYLTDDYEGGETRFIKSGLTFRGEAGDVLMFRNADSQGRADPLSEHAGLPVRRGTKIVLSCWIRDGQYRFPPPVPVSRRF